MPTIVTRGAMSAGAFGFASGSTVRCSWVAAFTTNLSSTCGATMFSFTNGAFDKSSNFYTSGNASPTLTNNYSQMILASITNKASIGAIKYINASNYCTWSFNTNYAIAYNTTEIAINNNCNVYFRTSIGDGLVINQYSIPVIVSGTSLNNVSQTGYPSQTVSGYLFDSSNNLYVSGAYTTYCSCCGSCYFPYIGKYNSSNSTRIAETRYRALTKGYCYPLKGHGMDACGNIYQAVADPCKVIKIIKFNSSLSIVSSYKGAPVSGTTISNNSTYGSYGVDKSGNSYLSYPYSSYLYFAKINNSGVTQWAKGFTLGACGTAISYPGAVGFDKFCNVYVGINPPTSAYNYVVKLSPSGTVLWQRSFKITSSASLISTAGQSQIVIDYYGCGILTNQYGYTSTNNFVSAFARLPNDGTKTGTYTVTVSGQTVTLYWASSSITIITPSITNLSSTSVTTTTGAFCSVHTQCGSLISLSSAYGGAKVI